MRGFSADAPPLLALASWYIARAANARTSAWRPMNVLTGAGTARPGNASTAPEATSAARIPG